ncbi:hypothetical protein Lal_00022944 [Lupinus albus]|uniref:Putative transcription factor bHLH family n=1 Tax=Lupinus albus TaxID=3870 RepID=A0A6A5N168_LUPAL|nr:putative transcription factor bHLH family [Lupinus albus]KAF1880914.1 hypothetical protein Lal_00022944 [Lupinus albus]
MSMENQDQHEIRFSCENHQLSFSNSTCSKESNEKLEIKPYKKEEGGYIGKTLEKEGMSRIKRERRQKTRNLFSTLHALLPQLPSKVNQKTIVNEAINYIKSLEQTVQKLEKQKQERLHSIYRKASLIDDHGSSNNLSCEMVMGNPSNSTLASIPHQPVNVKTLSSPNVVLNICENEAQFFVYTSKKLDLLTSIASVLEKFKIEVMYANIWSKDDKHGVMILASQKNMVPSHQFPKTISLGEVYKQAAAEINALVS